MRSHNPPTRQNLLKLGREATNIADGLKVLNSKREALMHAFLSQVSERVKRYDALRVDCRRGSASLVETVSATGREGLRSVGYGTKRKFGLEAHKETIWGVSVATFKVHPFVRNFKQRGYSAEAVPAVVHEAARTFETILNSLLGAAATEVRLKRVGSEVKKVSRRISALEGFILPPLESERKRIGEKLEEMERDENFRFRHLKRKRSR